MPSIWYHLMTPPVKCCGCWAGTGWPFTFLWRCRRCLAFSRTLSDRRSLMSWLESLIFSISSASSFFCVSAPFYNQMFDIHMYKSGVICPVISTSNLKSIQVSKHSFITPSRLLKMSSHVIYSEEKIKLRWTVTFSSTFAFLDCDIISWKTRSCRTNVSIAVNEKSAEQTKSQIRTYFFWHDICYFVFVISPPLLFIYFSTK